MVFNRTKPHTGIFILGVLLLAFWLQPAYSIGQNITSPQSFFGFTPGDDYKLFDYKQLIGYLKLLESESERVYLEEIGQSWNGNAIYALAVSSPENLSRLDELKEMNAMLALQTGLDEDVKAHIYKNGRVFVSATMSMHASEVGPTQSVPLITYELATTDDPQKLRWLDETVLLIVPSHNPDGQDMTVAHYNKYLGTKYERTSMPGVYHKYVGHNINRDFIMLTQPENVAVSRLFSHHWFPQLTVERHQMGAGGVRYFVPPPTDPIAENIDAGVWNWIGIFGARMMQRMTADSLKGVTQNYLFDMYWPGPTETALWKNVISMLTEAANVHLATPVYVEPNEIRVFGKGLSEYKKSINMPEPWPGGWWRLGDIVAYEISSLWGMMDAAATHREEILRFRNSITEKMVRLGQVSPPFHYILPQAQHDPSVLNALVKLMHEHGVKTYRLTDDVFFEGKLFRKGDVVIPLSQPFRPFIKEVMEVQHFPVRHHSPGGEMMRPYDVTSWSLPLHMGVESHEINKPIAGIDALMEETTSIDTPHFTESPGYLFRTTNNESYLAVFQALSKGIEVKRLARDHHIGDVDAKAGDFIVKNSPKLNEIWQTLTVAPEQLESMEGFDAKVVKLPNIGLVEHYFHDMDAGWSRYIFDLHGIPYRILRPADLRKGVPAGIEMLLFPSSGKSVLVDGHFGGPDDMYFFNYPPEYVKAMGKEGLEKLMAWVSNGGRIVAWEQSTKVFEGALQIETGKDTKDSFRLPFRDISPDLVKQGLDVPGSLLQIELLQGHPLSLGMPRNVNVFSRGNPVFATSIPNFDMDRRVIGSFVERDILVSGFARNTELLSQKPAIIWLQKGKGQLVLFAFNPQFRSNTHGTYKLLFNALLME